MADNDIAKLKVLLGYWIEHSREHSQEFKEWSGRAEAAGKPKTARELSQASQEMDQAAESLGRALESLGK
jgi:hypothetical protein